VEIMNFGRSGYTQTEQLLVLREDVLSFDPDMVALVFFPGNDINDVREETSPEKNRPFFLRSPSGEWILDASFREEPRYRFRQWINGIKQRTVLVSLVGDRCNAYVRNRRHQKQREK